MYELKRNLPIGQQVLCGLFWVIGTFYAVTFIVPLHDRDWYEIARHILWMCVAFYMPAMVKRAHLTRYELQEQMAMLRNYRGTDTSILNWIQDGPWQEYRKEHPDADESIRTEVLKQMHKKEDL